MNLDYIVDQTREEEKGGEFVVPIVNENISIEETSVSPSKEQKEKKEKDGNEEKDDSHSEKKDSPHQDKGDTCSNNDESDQGPLGGKHQEVSFSKEERTGTNSQDIEINQDSKQQEN
jgi:hypothetical protein